MSSNDGVLTRRFSIGAAALRVRCASMTVRDAVEALFSDLAEADETVEFHEATLVETAGELTLRIGEQSYDPESPTGALGTLVTAVSRLALDTDPTRLHLHGAGLSLDGRGVLISAESGTGKTTLAAALIQRGWTYVSDEMISVLPDSRTAWGFPKPLMVKSGGGGLLPELEHVRVALEPDDSLWWLVPAGALEAPVAGAFEPSVIVVLYRSQDGSTTHAPVPTRLHPADAVVALMGQTMDAERFGPDAALAIAQLTGRCHCVALPVGPLDSSATVLAQLARSEMAPDDARELDPLAVAEIRGWRVAPAVRSILIADRVVVHDTAAGAIMALDEAGTGMWRAFHGEAPDWWRADALDVPGTVGFLEQLSAHNLVLHADSAKAAPG